MSYLNETGLSLLWTKIKNLFPLTTITKSIKLTGDWQDTGIVGTDLSGTGSYIIQVGVNDGTNTSLYDEIWTGVMSWYSGTTNSTVSEEILLHNVGHADNSREIFLRTIRTSGSSNPIKLQIAANFNASAATTVTFKFRKMI